MIREWKEKKQKMKKTKEKDESKLRWITWKTTEKNRKKEKKKYCEERSMVEWHRNETEGLTDFNFTEIPENMEIKTRFPFPLVSMGCQNNGISDVFV